MCLLPYSQVCIGFGPLLGALKPKEGSKAYHLRQQHAASKPGYGRCCDGTHAASKHAAGMHLTLATWGTKAQPPWCDAINTECRKTRAHGRRSASVVTQTVSRSPCPDYFTCGGRRFEPSKFRFPASLGPFWGLSQPGFEAHGWGRNPSRSGHQPLDPCWRPCV